MNRILAFVVAASTLLTVSDARIDAYLEKRAAESRGAAIAAAEAIVPEFSLAEARERLAGEASQFEHDWQILYYAKLAELMDSSTPPIAPMDSTGALFNISDLDGNGTPELLVSDGTYHAAPGYLYTVRHDGLVLAGIYGSYGEFQYDFERNYIRNAYSGQGATYTTIHHFEDGVATEVIGFYSYEGSVPSIPETYQINGQGVSKDIYHAAYDPYSFESFDGKEGFVARRYYIIQATVERVLREPY